jgi:hypothetical protein
MSKISELSDGGSLVSTDFLIAVRSGGNVKVKMDTINVDQVDLGDNEFIRLGNSQDLTLVHNASNSIINQAGIGDLLIQKAGSTKLTVNSSGIDVTGTVTADGLTVSASAATANITSTSGGATLNLTHPTATDGYSIRQGNANADDFRIFEGSKIKLNITTGGDISFYEDTGTTAKLFWDASAESLGIGSTSPSAPMHVQTSHSSTDVTAANTNSTVIIGNSAAGNGVYNAIKFSANQQDMYIMSFNNSTQADRRMGFFLGSVAGDATSDERLSILGNGNVGIGTSSPLELLHVSEGSSGAGRSSDADTLFLENNGNAGITIGSSTTGSGSVRFADSGGTGRGVLLYDHSSDFMSFHSAGGERMRITSAGLVGINSNSPAATLHTVANSGTTALLTTGASGNNIASFYTSGGSQALTLDSSGNLLVGKTAPNSALAGVQILPEGDVGITRNGSHSLLLNRLTSDGDIALFRKDGATVGSISNQNAYFFISGGSAGGVHSGLRFIDQQSFRPCTSAGANLDNVIALGNSSARFDDIYATNGTIQTSDRNEKQDIEALSDAEQRVAVAAKGLLRKFRWKSSVAEKGDEARTHFGIIAQDLQAAFEAEGLDAGDYAMFINSTWTDEETGEERSRMGVRYSELLAFIIAAI